MCGIAGIFTVAQGVIEPTAVIGMRDSMSHRGPDDSGIFVDETGRVALAHRRLSIIDLSPLGHQPMCNEDETVWITYNGEIYNFASLRSLLLERGHTFRSQSDTEVLLHLYEEYSEKCVDHLRGMFSFAIWDGRRRELFLARDRFGIKPLYYFHDGERFLFASELKGIMAYPGVPREIDHSSVYDYLSYRYVPTPKTIFKHVKKLPPATIMTVALEGDSLRVRSARYWDIRFNAKGVPASDDIPRLLSEAAELHLISDVPLGVMLSGGVDSSLVTGLVCKSLGREAETFSIGFDVAKHSEAPYARRVAELFGTTHHEKTATFDDLDGSLKWIVSAYDEPFADGSALPTHSVCELARQHVAVALAGDGGDELCAGYGWYYRWLELRRIDRFCPAPIRKAIQSAVPGSWKIRKFGRTFLLDPLEQYLRLVGAFTPYEKMQLLTPAFLKQFRDYDDLWQLRSFYHEDLDPISRMQYMDIHTYLPDDILVKVDRASMAVSLEVRPPLLDHKVAEALASLPVQDRFRDGIAKYALKQVLRKWLPDDLVDRKKQGFSVPWSVWLSPAIVRDRLSDGALVRSGIIAPEAIRNAPDRQISGGKAWTLLVLEEWYRMNAV